MPRPDGGTHRACLAHLDGPGRAAYLAGLRPGARVDHRGTAFTDGLLDALLGALDDARAGRAVVGHAAFEEALFLGRARFTRAAFPDGACFDGATFLGRADFNDTVLGGETSFRKASFLDHAWFHDAEFTAHAGFGDARFGGDAGFSRAAFAAGAGFTGAVFAGSAHFSAADLAGEVCFREADFHGDCYFGATVFHDGATFRRAVFRAAPAVGPLACRGTLDLSWARFLGTTTLEAAATSVDCRKSSWASGAALRLRYAAVDLVDVIAERSLSVTAHPRPFLPEADGERPFESVLAARDPGVRVRSLSGSDAGNLALNDLDLSSCLFGGALHLDRLGLEGCCVFARTPARRMPFLPLRRWTPRRVLAEEHHWRAARGARGWTPAPEGVEVRSPAALASTYRQLRTSLENGKNHPGAGDFHYGEMEMRRHDGERADGQRALLLLYWAVSGYALRVGRTLLWLLATTAAAVAAVALWGLPPEPHRPVSAAGSPTGTAAGTAPDREAGGGRLDTSVRTVLNVVGLRSGPRELTLAGACADGTFRLVAPVLLGLTAVAVRNRVRR
ncbi:pentapeptide repeat-containing protein [Streptomyces huiliensis]|uniref:pentapeptide repeat-containing protein n=1 Tax=Streptomyces huiliensis TaxID=2876027 RepID=UPI001CBAA6E2|nr:pentapeptide repeat-containing protein [Streptomyces huiliensis]